VTPRGRRLARRVNAAREDVLALARQLIDERELRQTLDLLRKLLGYTPFADLVARRRDLLHAKAPERSARETP
ncbi:MAG: hypothetical protein M3155_04935, partial [Actinomycetota bacterium]|nr:hypothetical protein [Actinomycetota bacterium]